VELVYSIAQGILYTIPLYSMIGYEWKADKFFYFMFFLTCSFLYFSLFGAMLVTCTPSAMLASIVVSFSLTGWNIFAGFLVPRPVGISESPQHYVLYTTLGCQFNFRKLFRSCRRCLSGGDGSTGATRCPGPSTASRRRSSAT
jgi:hypothetical protein